MSIKKLRQSFALAPHHTKIVLMNIPNLLTSLRIVLIPVLVLFFYLPTRWSHFACAMVFGLAALTDWLDGYLARILHQSSKLGAFLDPVADKLIVSISLVLLVSQTDLPLLAIPAAVIVGREIVVSALREWMAEIGKRANVAVSFLGKYKTTVQMLALILLLAYQPGQHKWLGVSGYLLLYLAAILTLWSMLKYLKAAWPDLR